MRGVALALVLCCCEGPPASVPAGSPAAQGALQAEQLAQLAQQVDQVAHQLQSIGDPQLPGDLDQAALSDMAERMARLEELSVAIHRQLDQMDELARIKAQETPSAP